MAPPWKEIYQKDQERKQDFEEAEKIYRNLLQVYTDYGREVIVLPKIPVQARVDFVLELTLHSSL